MSKRVLDVGQCGPDHAGICRFLKQHFDVKIDQAHSSGEALALAGGAKYDLILINRLFDADGSPGMDTLSELVTTFSYPVMLVSNHKEAQDRAVEAGAVPGFGKSNLTASTTIELLSQYLANS